MKKVIKIFIIILIYISGCIPSYLLLKADWQRTFHSWQVKDRNMAIGFSSFSYVSLIAAGYSYYIQPIMESKEPAKW